MDRELDLRTLLGILSARSPEGVLRLGLDSLSSIQILRPNDNKVVPSWIQPGTTPHFFVLASEILLFSSSEFFYILLEECFEVELIVFEEEGLDFGEGFVEDEPPQIRDDI